MIDFAPAGFHLLRPWWLLALPVAAWLAWRWRGRNAAGAWERVVDPALREHLLEPSAARGARWRALGAGLAVALAVLALAGPSWRREAQPLWEAKAPLVVAFDLSPAMLATDLPPSRLSRARAKLATLLRERRGGEVGLLVYADGAYTVAPLTDDAANVAVFLDALAPDIMPGASGEADAAAAIGRAARLLRQAGFDRGDILLVSGSAMSASASSEATRAARDGYRVSVLDAGPATAGITAADAAGAVAAAGGGRRAALADDDSDLAALGVLDAAPAGTLARERDGGASWRDDGYWLLLPLLALAAFAFRRNGAIAVLALCLVLPWRPAAAAGVDWWQRADQRAHRQMVQGARAYRAGDYAAAARAWQGVQGADADYNRGNALARQGRYEDAIAAYDAALRARPGMADALANRKAVEAAMKRRPPTGKGDRQQSGDKGDREEPQDGDSAQRDGGQDQDRAKAAQQAQRERDAWRARAGDQGAPQDGHMQESQADHERRLANQARLQRVPDDPGGLLRERLRLEYERRRAEGE